MRQLSLVLALLGLSFIFVMPIAPAQAQASRTWVSGVGDDVNPCSRTAPCKTFAGAISKTAAGGEINCLDPAGYGGLTITKAITIECNGTFGSVLVAGTNGITVSAGANDVVILRGLSINGIRTGINGVQFNSGAQLTIDGCYIFGFSGNAVSVSVSTVADLYVTNSYLTSSNKGIFVTTTASQVLAAINNTAIVNMATNGFEAAAGSIVASLTNSIITSTGNGVIVSGAGPQVNVESSTVANNGTAFNAFAASATIRVANNGIYNNGVNFNIAAGGGINSAGNNRITSGGTTVPSGSITLQ
jgi:hypothetical protein